MLNFSADSGPVDIPLSNFTGIVVNHIEKKFLS